MKPYRILFVAWVLLALIMAACGGGGGAGSEETPAGGTPPAGGGTGGGQGWTTVNVLPGSVDAFQAAYFPLADVRIWSPTRFPILKGTVDGAVEKVNGAPFFHFALKGESQTYKVEGIPEASHAPNVFASPVIEASREPQPGDSVTVFGELIEVRLVADYVAVEGKGVWFYRSHLRPLEVRPEIMELYDGLPVVARGMINSMSPRGDFYELGPDQSLSSQSIGADALVVGTFRKSSPMPYIAVADIYVQQGGAYTSILK